MKIFKNTYLILLICVSVWLLTYTTMYILKPNLVKPFMEVTAWLIGIVIALVQINKLCLEKDKNIVEIGPRFKVRLSKEQCLGFRKARLEIQAGKFDCQLFSVSMENAVFLNTRRTDKLELNILLEAEHSKFLDVLIAKPSNNEDDIIISLLWLNAETGNRIEHNSHYTLVNSLFKPESLNWINL